MGETVGSEVAALASADLLVNLTPHDVAITGQSPDGLPDQAGGVSLVRVPRGGSFARVDDDAATISREPIVTRAGVVSLTRLRRDGRLVDLPDPQPGTRFVVSRLTAFAARERSDLVFPFGEIREDGRITGALGLGAFVPDEIHGETSREWRPADGGRLAGRTVDKPWLIAALFAASTMFLGTAFGTLPGALEESAGDHLNLWLTIGFGTAGAVLLAIAAWRWFRGGMIRRQRGTAYVICEEERGWRLENKDAMIAEAVAGFDKTMEVLGPHGLGFAWDWEADAHAAPQWDRRAEELVSSFIAVHKTDDKDTPNALFIWASWPVAIAFGARASARDRNAPLSVRQRPSNSSGKIIRPKLTDGAHDFLATKNVPPLEIVAPSLMAVRLTSDPLTVSVRRIGTLEREHGEDGREESHPTIVRDNPHSLLLLVVRISYGPIGPIDVDLDRTSPFGLEVAPSLIGHSLHSGTQRIPVAEWRLAPRDASMGQAPGDLPWAAFPSAAAEISGWVAEQADVHRAKVVLLAARMPQELGVGLGIQLRQRSWDLAGGHRWPEHVYPAIWTGDNQRLIVPDLHLGADSVPSQRV